MIRSFLIKNSKFIASITGLGLLALVPLFVQTTYYLDIVISVIVNAVLAISFIVMLRAGLISLGLAAFWGIGAYASAILSVKFGFSFWLCLPLAIIITLLFALGLGYVLIRSSGFTFLILTCVIGLLFIIIVGNIPYLGGYDGIPDIPSPEAIQLPFLPVIEFTTKTQMFYLALALFIIVILVVSAFYSSWAGRAWTAIGLNTRLAESIGIDIFKYKLLSFVVASGILGLIGSFYAHYHNYIFPDSFGFFSTIYAQIYAILGGIGFAVLGPFVGSAIMTIFPEVMRIANTLSPIIVGVLLILLVMFMPRGLLGLLYKKSGSEKDSIVKVLESISRERNKTKKQ